MSKKTKIGQEKLNSEAGFSLLELISVIAIIGLISTTLGMILINQFEFWEFGSNSVQVINEAKLLSSYLKQDIAESISYYQLDGKLYLQQDRNEDGNIERQIHYKTDESGQLKRRVSYVNRLPISETKERVLTTTFESMDIQAINQHQIDLELKFSAGGAVEKIKRSFYLADWQNSSFDNTLDFSGTSDYVALDHYLASNNYRELTLLAKIKTIEEEGVIYGFDEGQYFSFGLDNGRLSFAINPYGSNNTQSFSITNRIDNGAAHIVAVTVAESDYYSWNLVRIYLNGNLETSNYIYTENNAFGSGNTSYGFLGVDSRASSFNGDKASDYFTGQIYWLQHWNKALTEQQLDIYSSTDISGSEQGLRAYYPIKKQDLVLYDYLGLRHGAIFGPTYSRD